MPRALYIPTIEDRMEGQDGSPIVYVNGKRHVLPAGAGDVTLLAYLRGARRLAPRPQPRPILPRSSSPSPAVPSSVIFFPRPYPSEIKRKDARASAVAVGLRMSSGASRQAERTAVPLEEEAGGSSPPSGIVRLHLGGRQKLPQSHEAKPLSSPERPSRRSWLET